MTASVDGRAQWKVVAVMQLPGLQEGEIFLGGVCRLNGQLDLRIAAIVERDEEPGPFYSTVQRAWIASTTLHRFEPFTEQGVDCENVGYGLE